MGLKYEMSVTVLGIPLQDFQEVSVGGSAAQKHPIGGLLQDARKRTNGRTTFLQRSKIYCLQSQGIAVFRTYPSTTCNKNEYLTYPRNPRNLGDLIIQYDHGRTGFLSFGHTRYVLVCSKNSPHWEKVIHAIECRQGSEDDVYNCPDYVSPPFSD